MPTSILGIVVVISGAFLAVGALIFLIGVMSDNSWNWREKRMKMGALTCCLSGVVLVLSLVLPHI